MKSKTNAHSQKQNAKRTASGEKNTHRILNKMKQNKQTAKKIIMKSNLSNPTCNIKKKFLFFARARAFAIQFRQMCIKLFLSFFPNIFSAFAVRLFLYSKHQSVCECCALDCFEFTQHTFSFSFSSRSMRMRICNAHFLRANLFSVIITIIVVIWFAFLLSLSIV